MSLLDRNEVNGCDLLVLSKPFFEDDDENDTIILSGSAGQYETGDQRCPLLIKPRFERDVGQGAPFRKCLMLHVLLHDLRTSELISEGVLDFGQSCGTRGRYGYSTTLNFRRGEALRCFSLLNG